MYIYAIIVHYIDNKLPLCYLSTCNLQCGLQKSSLSLPGIANMPKVSINAPAPDFTLQDYQGNPVSLSDYKEKQNVLLVFNRGFQ